MRAIRVARARRPDPSVLLRAPGPTFTWVAAATDIGPPTFKAIVLLGFNSHFVLSGPTVTAVSDVVYADGFEP